MKALAVSSGKRISAAPDVPPVADTLPGFEAATWHGVLAPARVTSDIMQKLHAGNYAVLQLQMLDARAHMATLGLSPAGDGPREFAEVIRLDLEKWGKVIRSLPPV